MMANHIADFKDLELLKTFWLQQQNHPNNDFRHYKLVCDLRDNILNPYVIYVQKDGEIFALIIGRIERTLITPSIGYFKPVKIKSNILSFIHEGFIGVSDSDIAESIVSKLKTILKQKEVDVIQVYHLPEHSPFVQSVFRWQSAKWINRYIEWSTHREMTLFSEKGYLLKNMKSKHRSWIKSREKKLNGAYPNQISWQWISNFQDILSFCDAIDEVATLSYQRGLDAGFKNNIEYQKRYEFFNGNKQLRAQLLKIDNRVRAFWIGIVYRNTFYSTETAYDPKLREFEPGTLLFIKMVDQLIDEGISKVDFGLGDAHYKERFGTNEWREASFYLFAPTLKGFTLRTTIYLFNMLSSFGKKLLTRIGIIDKVKNRWRKIVSSRPKS